MKNREGLNYYSEKDVLTIETTCQQRIKVEQIYLKGYLIRLNWCRRQQSLLDSNKYSHSYFFSLPDELPFYISKVLAGTMWKCMDEDRTDYPGAWEETKIEILKFSITEIRLLQATKDRRIN